MTKRSGTVLVVIDREPARLDDLADPVLRHDIGAARMPFISA